MKLLSVNIGQKRTQQKGNEIETTGIYKLPVQEPVEIRSLGIQSDFICDQKNHGFTSIFVNLRTFRKPRSIPADRMVRNVSSLLSWQRFDVPPPGF